MIHNHDYDPSCKEEAKDGKLVGECIVRYWDKDFNEVFPDDR